MEFFFSDRIDVTGIFLDLALVALTTGVTYYLFSALPVRRRKKQLHMYLKEIRSKIKKDIIAPHKEIKKTYWQYNKEVQIENTEDTETETCVEIHDFENFILHLKRFQYLKDKFSTIWRGSEIIAIINIMIMDNEKYIELSSSLSRLEKGIDHFDRVLSSIHENIHIVEKERDLISDDDKDFLAVCLDSLDLVDYLSKISITNINKTVGQPKFES